MSTSRRTVALVTGATDGLGRAVAEELARRGCEVLLHGRSVARLAAAKAEIAEAVPGAVLRGYRADLASLEQVRGLAAAVTRDEPALHVLVNNAGIGAGLPDSREREVSADGIELRLAVNHLAPLVLSRRLAPLLRASAPARVVQVASLGQAPMDFDDPQVEHGYSGPRAYCQAKLAQISAGFTLARELAPGGVTVTSLHPGTYMPTKIVLQDGGHEIDSMASGVAAVTRLALAPELDGVTGRFFDRQAEAAPNPQASDRAAQARLWALSLELAGET